MRGEFLDLTGGRVYYYAAGTRGAGVPVVLIHGFPTSGHLWTDVVPLLPAGHRAVVLDLLGFGRSDPPENSNVGIAGHANRLVELLDVLGIRRACLVGHDVGGAVAQSVAIQHRPRVSHLVLIDSVALSSGLGHRIRIPDVIAPLTRHLPASILASAVRMGVIRGYVDRERGRRSLDVYLRTFATSEGRDSLVKHIKALGGTDTTELADHLQDIHLPASVIWGERDPFLPVSLGERLHRGIAGSQLRTIANARHFVPEEAPRVVAETIAEVLAVSP